MIPIDIHTHHVPSIAGTAVLNIGPLEAALPFAGLYSVGIHPWRIAPGWEAQLEDVARLSVCPQVVALGECGLDKVCLKGMASVAERESAFSLQVRVFEAHIRLSECCEKPLIVHCVKACNELVVLRRRHKPRQAWVVHGFRGNRQVASMLLAEGFHLSFGEHYQSEALRSVPAERLFVETDESRLPIGSVIEKVACDRSVPFAALVSQIQTNYQNTFLL
mgnify:CR=1 FL=1